jgi:histidine triad (HIT) family protein
MIPELADGPLRVDSSRSVAAPQQAAFDPLQTFAAIGHHQRMNRISHAPSGYDCPFCSIVAGDQLDDVTTTQAEVLVRTPVVTAFVSSGQWRNNAGHVLVVPNEHYENLYELPTSLAVPLQEVTQRIAIALKSAFGCPGTSVRQHNEPHGGQDVWHYHVHVFPRYENDGLYGATRHAVDLAERLVQAEAIRSHL